MRKKNNNNWQSIKQTVTTKSAFCANAKIGLATSQLFFELQQHFMHCVICLHFERNTNFHVEPSL